MSYSPTNLISYNISIGGDGSDLSRCWEGHPDFHVLPTFAFLAVVNIMGKVTMSMPEFLPNFKHHNHVHGEHYLEQFRPFATSLSIIVLTSQARIIDIVDRGKGVTVVVGITTSEKKTGEKICYNEWTSFIRQVPGHGASAPGPARSFQLPRQAPNSVVAHQTTHTQSALYRATSTEWNPMHISPTHAKEGGFDTPILSGSCTIGMGVKHILDTFAGGRVERFKSVKLRLHAPVFIGEKVQTEMWIQDQPTHPQLEMGWKNGVTSIVYRQVVLNEDSGAVDSGRVVISNAVVELWNKPEGKSMM